MEEPLPPDNPWVELENVVLTPHAGAMTQDAFDREITIGVDNVAAFLEGDPTNVVNPAVMDRRR
jgi:phosphoglycerate dehydrogenase-like enzyme